MTSIGRTLALGRPTYKILPGRELSLMIMGQNIWLVIIVIFIALVLLGVITVATK